MRKEVFFAIVAGTLIGLLIAFGVWKITQSVRKMPIIEIKKNIPPKVSISLNIENIDDFDVITENPFLIKGSNKPMSDIIISTIDEDFYVKVNKDGIFEKEIDLPAGISELKINEQKIIIVYSSEFKKYVTTEEEENSTSYVGTITDIATQTIQVKTTNGDIKQISTSGDTSYINTLKKNTEVKTTDLAIGDYIVAMGFINGNKVLNTKRILIVSPVVTNNFEFEKITIEKLTKTTINNITMPKKWKGPNIKELKEGQEVIIVGTKENDKFTLRTIFATVE